MKLRLLSLALAVLLPYFASAQLIISTAPAGTIASQNANAVAITGGTITGTTLSGATFAATGTPTITLGSGGTVLYSGGALGTPSSGTLTNCGGSPTLGTVTATIGVVLNESATGLDFFTKYTNASNYGRLRIYVEPNGGYGRIDLTDSGSGYIAGLIIGRDEGHPTYIDGANIYIRPGGAQQMSVTSGGVTIGAGSAITSSGAGGAMGALSFVTPGTGVATLLAGASSGTGGPAGTVSPTFTGTVSATTVSATQMVIANNAYLGFGSQGYFFNLGDGIFRLSDTAQSALPMLRLGGDSASYPGIKRSGTTLAVRLANDSGDAPLSASNLTASGNIIASGSSSVIRMKGYTVATLPAGTQGDTAYVTDALAPTFLATVVGNGSVVTPVFYNGSAWVGY